MTRAPDTWPTEAVEAYEERAALMEHEGGLDRDEAERQALEIVRWVFDL